MDPVYLCTHFGVRAVQQLLQAEVCDHGRRLMERCWSSASCLLESFETDGEFYVDRAGPWMRIQLGEGEWRSTGLSRSHILAGDPRLAALILAAVIDYHLHQPEARREDIEYVDGLFTLLRQASGIVARGRGDRCRGDRDWRCDLLVGTQSR